MCAECFPACSQTQLELLWKGRRWWNVRRTRTGLAPVAIMWWGHLVGKWRARGVCCNVLGRCDIGDDEGQTLQALTWNTSCSISVPAGTLRIFSHQTFQPVWLNSSRGNNPRGCVTADPQSPSITTTKIPEIKKGIEQKEDRKNNEKMGWTRGSAGRKAVWLAGGKGQSGLSCVWQRHKERWIMPRKPASTLTFSKRTEGMGSEKKLPETIMRYEMKPIKSQEIFSL